MDLTDREIALIRDSFARLKADRSDVNPFGDAFYARVFERMPEARRLFRPDLEGQGMQFLTTLHVLVDHLDDPGRVDEELAKLGQGHAAYGVKDEHFPPMGEALMDTMRASLGSEFSDEAETAWRKAYEGIARRMIAAAG